LTIADEMMDNLVNSSFEGLAVPTFKLFKNLRESAEMISVLVFQPPRQRSRFACGVGPTTTISFFTLQK